MNIGLNGLLLNAVYMPDSGEDINAFEVIEFSTEVLDKMTVRYLGMDKMYELYSTGKPVYGWYFRDGSIHYRCPVLTVRGADTVKDVIGSSSEFTIPNSAVSKIYEFIKNGYYYVSPNYESAEVKERYIVKLSLCSISTSTLHVYISFKGDNGWRTETIYSVDGYNESPYMGDFMIGSVNKLKDETLAYAGNVEFGGSVLYLYRVLKDELNMNPRYIPASMPLPVGLINTLAYQTDCSNYVLSLLRDFSKSLRSELSLDIEEPSEHRSYPSRSTAGRVLSITTNIGKPNKEFKQLILREATKIAKEILSKCEEGSGLDPLTVFDTSQNAVCMHLFNNDYLYHEVECILTLTRCLILSKGQKDIMLYTYVQDEIAEKRLEYQACSLYLLQFRISAYKGWSDKGLNNRMYYIGGAYPYDSVVVTK